MRQDYYQDYYFLERNHWWFRARQEILKAFIRQNNLVHKDGSILNVGPATGVSSLMLEEFAAVQSLEVDSGCCEFMCETLKLKVDKGTVKKLPYADESMDLVCAFDVLEHVDDDKSGFEEMVRVCRPGGYILITVPAFPFLWSEHDMINDHFRRYRKEGLMELCAKPEHWVYCSYFNSWLFLPITVYRLLAKYVIKSRTANSEKAASDFAVKGQNRLTASLLYWVFRSERFWIRRRWILPVGVSLLGLWRKPDSL